MTTLAGNETLRDELLALEERHKTAIAREAEAWWDKVGRNLIPLRFNEGVDGLPRVSTGGGFPSIIVPPDKRRELQSGILNALPFTALTRAEQGEIIAAYYVNIWKPKRSLN